MTPGMGMNLFILISHLYMHPRQIFNTKLQSFIKGKNGKIILKSLKIESEIRKTIHVQCVVKELDNMDNLSMIASY